MIKVNNFDLLNSSLKGTNLIEASAGTGKTYAITGLFLRLILEKNLSVNEILVVTFTEAATDELKHRIRNKLRRAMEAFSSGLSEDALLNELVKRNKDTKTALALLREGLRDFDKAAIFTIHGFSRRVLHENAFESGCLFDTELVTEQEDIKREIVDDFWRNHFYQASLLFVNYAIHKKFSPNGLISFLRGRLARPYLKIIPQVEIPDTSGSEKEFRASFDGVCNAWESARTNVENILATDEGLNRVKYNKAKVPLWIEAMDRYLASGVNNPLLFNAFFKFTSGELKVSVKKDRTPPTHKFFELCESLLQRQKELERVFEERLLGLKAALFHYAEDQLAKRKEEKNVQSFDDLLLKLYRALKEKGGEYLARAMRKKFRAALIDEFQDTDPVQYAIFNQVFGAKGSTLFLIGDPKQAIYGFRGADIFAYMKAKQDVVFQHTLSENWRSDPRLIAAINTIFDGKELPFVYDEIPFNPAVPAPKKDPALLELNGKTESPFQLWFLEAKKVTNSGKPISKALASQLIPGAVAAEISRLLALGRKGLALLGKKPLMEGDISVLVRTNAQARLVQEALAELNIPGVLFSTGNLFDSHEALEMERVLLAVSLPKNERHIRAALTTDMMGLKGEDLDILMEDETGWEEWIAKFRMYHDLWNEHGFIRMFRYLLLQEEVLPRLMSKKDGERRNTNLLHLTEVLQQTSVEKKLGMIESLKWLSEQRDESAPRLDEHQLRLESDENAVKLVTVHKSKGLEYPVVFCPFSWDGSKIKKSNKPFLFHNEAQERTPTLDLGSEERDENRAFAEKELLAENLRLLYVALTRAKNRCYLVWGRFNQAETSALAYLLHQPESFETGNVVQAIAERFNSLTDEAVKEALRASVSKAKGTISLTEMPAGQVGDVYTPLPGRKTALSCREFKGDIDRLWRISSFSSLTSGRPALEETADRDEIISPDGRDREEIEEPVIREKYSEIFSFPAGAKPGIFLHDILEHLDFAEREPAAMKKLVADKLDEYGFEHQWLDTICDMVTNVLSTPLDSAQKGPVLSFIKNEDRLNELEFYFPLKSVNPEKLKQIFQANPVSPLINDFPETIGMLQFAPTKGFMRGFMDLVFLWRDRFYLVDWKSNLLGDSPKDYNQEAMASAMKKECYILQYTIYTLALDQYLRLRMPEYSYEKHFGGVYYIFLRGVKPEMGPGFGIYRDFPSPELIEGLRKGLMEKG
ncbi:MAG: exodeoxyribonuclease V subunit beta [Deltaproteobacteria bacterium]|nr:exodeoxyribonuclease V subunit beta [Deltaproteobacteria bacterium]